MEPETHKPKSELQDKEAEGCCHASNIHKIDGTISVFTCKEEIIAGPLYPGHNPLMGLKNTNR